LIQYLNPLRLCPDTGQLWKNFLFSEPLKYNHNPGRFVNCYFGQTHQQQEIDYMKKIQGQLAAFEIKWKRKKAKFPTAFRTGYPESTFQWINRYQFEDFEKLE